MFACVAGLAIALFAIAALLNPRQYVGPVQKMPYESGMDPIHDTRRRFDVRFHLIAIAFLVFDVEVLFLYPWAVAAKRPDKPVAAESDRLKTYPTRPAVADGLKPAVPYDISAAVQEGLASDRHIVFAVPWCSLRCWPWGSFTIGGRAFFNGGSTVDTQERT